jgi:hypothetical protein
MSERRRVIRFVVWNTPNRGLWIHGASEAAGASILKSLREFRE